MSQSRRQAAAGLDLGLCGATRGRVLCNSTLTSSPLLGPRIPHLAPITPNGPSDSLKPCILHPGFRSFVCSYLLTYPPRARSQNYIYESHPCSAPVRQASEASQLAETRYLLPPKENPSAAFLISPGHLYFNRNSRASPVRDRNTPHNANPGMCFCIEAEPESSCQIPSLGRLLQFMACCVSAEYMLSIKKVGWHRRTRSHRAEHLCQSLQAEAL